MNILQDSYNPINILLDYILEVSQMLHSSSGKAQFAVLIVFTKNSDASIAIASNLHLYALFEVRRTWFNVVPIELFSSTRALAGPGISRKYRSSTQIPRTKIESRYPWW